MQNRRPSKDDGCCSISFLQYVLFIFTFVFYLVGCGLIAVGAWTIIAKSHYVSLLATSVYSITPLLLLGTGVAVLVVGMVGCYGVTKENRRAILLFMFLLLAVFFAEAVAGVMSYFYSAHVKTELDTSLKDTFRSRYGDDADTTSAIDKLQGEYDCCGAINYADWYDSAWYKRMNTQELVDERDGDTLKAPMSCCYSPVINCGVRDHPSNIRYSGCISVLTQYIQQHSIILASVALGLSTLQLCGVILACCLHIKLKDYEACMQSKQRAYQY